MAGKRIGILTSGGDCAGLNAAIRAVVLHASARYGWQVIGIHNGTAAYAARMIGMGFRFVTIANDSGLMAKAAREAVAETRKAAGDVAN